jgi:hypothetical protein
LGNARECERNGFEVSVMRNNTFPASGSKEMRRFRPHALLRRPGLEVEA